jgi:hypothetical protein
LRCHKWSFFGCHFYAIGETIAAQGLNQRDQKVVMDEAKKLKAICNRFVKFFGGKYEKGTTDEKINA